mmetsp:Transcript_135443/g.321010  ORF Transcript_135443/g.321010 Transcript_135443/m.321010 type:complete len:236 (+) Transcript_135443:1523-2230(+)
MLMLPVPDSSSSGSSRTRSSGSWVRRLSRSRISITRLCLVSVSGDTGEPGLAGSSCFTVGAATSGAFSPYSSTMEAQALRTKRTGSSATRRGLSLRELFLESAFATCSGVMARSVAVRPLTRTGWSQQVRSHGLLSGSCCQMSSCTSICRIHGGKTESSRDLARERVMRRAWTRRMVAGAETTRLCSAEELSLSLCPLSLSESEARRAFCFAPTISEAARGFTASSLMAAASPYC